MDPLTGPTHSDGSTAWPEHYLQTTGVDRVTELLYNSLSNRLEHSEIYIKQCRDVLLDAIEKAPRKDAVAGVYPLKRTQVWIVKHVFPQSNYTEPDYYDEARDAEEIEGIFFHEEDARALQEKLFESDLFEDEDDEYVKDYYVVETAEVI